MKVRAIELPLHHYTRTGQHRFKQFVSDCGGVYEASVKLDVPSFFIDQILRDGPVPDHVLDGIEQKIGPIRLTEHTPGFSDEISAGMPGDTLKTEAESEIVLKEFVESCGGLLAASLKLGVSTSTLQKFLSGSPVSKPTAQKVIAALNAIGCSIASERFDSPLSKLHIPFEISKLPHGSTQQQGVYPSSVRKIHEGLPISYATQRKLGISSEEGTSLNTPDHVRANPTSALASKLREIIKSDVDIFDLASKWGVTETSLRKIYEGKPVTRFLTRKVEAALACARPTDQVARPSAAIERLRSIHKLYKELGTLEAVGEQVGLTRERVRQLLVKGRGIGLFEYKPYEYPYISKDKLIDDYIQSPNLGYVAKINQISPSYLRKLLTAYSISEERLAECRAENKRARSIEQYNRLVDKEGHHLTTTELQSTSEGHSLHCRINRLWGTIDAFRETFNIPKPPRGSPSFREDTKRWREHRQQIAFVRRMQQLDQLREYLHSRGPSGTAEIAAECGMNQARAHHLLTLVLKSGEVRRVGQSYATKYVLTSN